MAAADIAISEPIEQEVVQEPVENEVELGLGHEEEVEQEAESSGHDAPPIKKVNDVLTKLKAEFPNESKELRAAYNSWQQISKIVKTPAEAQQLKTSLEALGGAEGITALQSKAATVDLIDEGIATGNTEIADDIFADPALAKGYGEKILPYSLDKLQETNPKLYESIIRPHAVAAMEAAGLGDVLSEVFDAIWANKLDDAKKLLHRTYGWLSDQKAQAAQSKPTANPEASKLVEDRKKFENEKNEAFKNDVNRDVLVHRDTEIEKALAPYLKIRKLAPETKDDLVGGIRNELKSILLRDQSYVSQTKAHFANPKRDKTQIAAYMKTKVQQAIPQAVENVWKRRGYGAFPTAGKTATNGTGGQTSTKTVLLSKKPNINDVDKSSKTWMEAWMAGKATMSNGPYKGRQVTWKAV